MKAAGSSNIKAVAGASGIALLTGALVFGLASIVVLPQTPRVHQPKTGFVLTSSTCPASSVTPPAFSVCGPAVGAGPLLVPGAPASGLPLTFYNGLKVGLSIYKLTVAFSNAFPVGCPASSLQLGGATVGGVPPTITGSQPNVTFTFATNHFFQVPGATSSAGTSIYHATLGLLDSGNQDACKNLGLSMSYTAWAQYTELYSTATTVVTSGSPSVVGTQVTFTATVTASATTGQDAVPSSPTGTVTFKDNGTAISGCAGLPVSSKSMTQAQATCPVTYNTTAGSPHPITVSYSNSDGNFVNSTSGSLSQTVSPSATTTAMTALPNPSNFASPVTLKATVTAASGPVPSAGTVSFYRGSPTSFHSLVGTRTVSGGVATTSTSSLPGGTDSLYAVYSGDNDDTGSTSPLYMQNVNRTSCITTATIGNLTIKSGQDICIRNTGSVSGNISVNSGGLLEILGGTVGGSVSVSAGGAVSSQSGGHIGGSLTASGAAWVTVCGSKISGNLSVSATTGLVLVGDNADDGSPVCEQNTVLGNVTISNNSGGVELGDNLVSGGMAVTGTSGAPLGTETTNSPEIEGNKIAGGLSCSGNSPAPIDDRQPNTVSGNRSGQCSAKGF